MPEVFKKSQTLLRSSKVLEEPARSRSPACKKTVISAMSPPCTSPASFRGRCPSSFERGCPSSRLSLQAFVSEEMCSHLQVFVSEEMCSFHFIFRQTPGPKVGRCCTVAWCCVPYESWIISTLQGWPRVVSHLLCATKAMFV